MTHVQPIESAQPRKRARKRADEAGQLIKYDDKAIARGKELVAKLKFQDKAVHLTEMELGELADRLETKYNDETLDRYAKDIDIDAARLKRCRSEFRAWQGIKAPARRAASCALIVRLIVMNLTGGWRNAAVGSLEL